MQFLFLTLNISISPFLLFTDIQGNKQCLYSSATWSKGEICVERKIWQVLDIKLVIQLESLLSLTGVLKAKTNWLFLIKTPTQGPHSYYKPDVNPVFKVLILLVPWNIILHF